MAEPITATLIGKRILLVIAGGIAAYKSLELIRRLRERGAAVRCVLTKAGAEFVTPLSVSALSGDKVYGELFSLTDEHEMGHIELSRAADLLVVAPATADLLAKMAHGRADDLASTVLLATDKPVLVAPAMNVRMWEHAATRDNLATLERRGTLRVGPEEGDMACGEYGFGRMAEPMQIVAAVETYFAAAAPLAGRKALVTSGPTWEALDPVRYIGNRSSGKQGHAIAQALARMGAETTLVSGPTRLDDPAGVTVVHIESARDMLAACEQDIATRGLLDVAVCAAAVADWHSAAPAGQKIKKTGGKPPALRLAENPDILATLSNLGNRRPRLVVGFAAETENVVANATAKRQRKGCDWIVANDVSAAANAGAGTFGGDVNSVHLITADGAASWPRMTKQEVAERLAATIGTALEPAA
jgi:phosphopantothenoylcysteine decarboxylase/phosphopantothenate--cysteine ligase